MTRHWIAFGDDALELRLSECAHKGGEVKKERLGLDALHAEASR